MPEIKVVKKRFKRKDNGEEFFKLFIKTPQGLIPISTASSFERYYLLNLVEEVF